MEEYGLFFENGLPVERVVTPEEILSLDPDTVFDVDRLRMDAKVTAEPSSPASDQVQPSSGSSFRPSPDKPNFARDTVPFEYKQKAVDFWNSGLRGRRTFESVKSRYARVANQKTLYAWEKLVVAGGSRTDKLRRVFELTKKAFLDSVTAHGIIHDQVGFRLIYL